MGHHVRPRRRLVVAHVVDRAGAGPGDGGSQRLRDVGHVDARERVTGPVDALRRAASHRGKRVAARPVDPGQAEDLDGDAVFRCPAYPVPRVVDPTGAGDAFAGGFAGHLAGLGRCTGDALREALVHASVMGSFAVESFSLDRLRNLDAREVAERARVLGEWAAFEPSATGASRV